MTDLDNNKHRMFRTVHEICVMNSAVWTPIPAFVSAVEQLGRNIDSIHSYGARLEGNGEGLTARKNELRENVKGLVMKVVGGMMGFTVAENMVELKEKFNYRPWQLDKVRDFELFEIAMAVHNRTLPFITRLSPFLVVEEDLANLESESLAFKDSLPGNRVRISENAASRKAMKALIRETDLLLKKTIDKLMLIYRQPMPQFYNEYKSARVILDMGHRRGKAEAKVEAEAKAES